MNNFDPEKETDGKREIVSHVHPVIGPYGQTVPSTFLGGSLFCPQSSVMD